MKVSLLVVSVIVAVVLAGCSAADMPPAPGSSQPSLNVQPTPGNEVNAGDAADESTISTCLSAHNYRSADDLRSELLRAAERRAIEALYGIDIRVVSEMTNFVLTEDQVRSIAAGRIRLKAIPDNPDYYQGENLGDGCIRATFFATEEDRWVFAPITLTGRRICRSTEQIDADRIREELERMAKIDILHNYDGRLQVAPEDRLLALLRNVIYLESGYVADTTTYCVAMEAGVLPILVDVLVDDLQDGKVARAPLPEVIPPTATHTPLPTPTNIPLATPTNKPVPTPTTSDATPTASVPMVMGDTAELREMGLNALNARSYDLAVQLLTKAIELAPADVYAYGNRASAYLALGRYDRAVADCDIAIELDPTQAVVYNNRGISFYYLKEYERAIADFDTAIELEPDYVDAYVTRGAAYGELGQYESAIADYDRAIDLEPDYAGAYNNRGIAHSELKQYQRAIADYDKAIELDPTFVLAYYNRGIDYERLGELAKARSSFQVASDLGYEPASEKLRP